MSLINKVFKYLINIPGKFKPIFTSKLFYIGCVIKLTLACLFSSEYLTELFIPFVTQFLSNPDQNPYIAFVNNGLSRSFPYPPLMLYIVASGKAFLGNTLLGLPLPNPDILSLRLPLFIADILLLYTMTKMSINHTRKFMLYYWLNPILIYITYIHGQLDVIPICFLFMATYVMYKNQFNFSAILLALGCCTKTHLILVFPLFLMLIPKSQKYLQQMASFIVIFFAILIVGNVPFMSPEFIKMVYQNAEQSKLLSIHFNLMKELTFYLIPAIILLLYLRFYTLKTKGREVFCAFLVFCYAALLLFIPPMQGWYYWIIPFLIITCVHNKLKTSFILNGLSISYFIYFLFSHQSDYFQIFQFINSDIFNLPIPLTLLQTYLNFDISIIGNISFTLLQTLLLAICIWIYYVITHNFLYNKMSSHPFLIGISGDSATGKTTLAELFTLIFGKVQATTIHGDDLHLWERGNENWDKVTHLNPKANNLYHEVSTIENLIAGKEIKRKHYNHDTGKFNDPEIIYPRNIMVFEGLHTFFLKSFSEKFDLKVFMKPNEILRKHWKLLRDSKRRSQTQKRIMSLIEKRRKDAEKYIYQQELKSDLIISWQPYKKIEKPGSKAKVKTYLVIRLSNHININRFLDQMNQFSKASIKHEYISNDKQECIIKTTSSKDQIDKVVTFYEDQLYHLGLFKPTWKEGLDGILQLLLCEVMLEIVQNH